MGKRLDNDACRVCSHTVVFCCLWCYERKRAIQVDRSAEVHRWSDTKASMKTAFIYQTVVRTPVWAEEKLTPHNRSDLLSSFLWGEEKNVSFVVLFNSYRNEPWMSYCNHHLTMKFVMKLYEKNNNQSTKNIITTKLYLLTIMIIIIMGFHFKSFIHTHTLSMLKYTIFLNRKRKVSLSLFIYFDQIYCDY